MFMPGKYEAPRKRVGGKILWILLALALVLALAFAAWKLVSRPAGDDTKPAPPATASGTTQTPPVTTDPPTETTLPEPEHVVATATIRAQGDLLMHGPIFDSASAAKQSDGTYDFSSVFRYIGEYMQAADFSIANLETTLRGSDMPYSGWPNFNCPDNIVDSAINAGMDALLTANNHSYDTLMPGFLRTVETVRAAGIPALGTRLTEEEPRYLVQDINGIQVGMVCYTYTTSMSGEKPRLNGNTPVENPALVNYFSYQNLDAFYAELRQIKEQMEEDGAEATIFFVHWGTEYEVTENSYQRTIAQAVCDMGFDAIIGSHPHVVQPAALLTGSQDPSHLTACIYSMGNAVSNQRREKMNLNTGHTEDGAMFTVTFEKYSDGTVYLAGAELLPTWVNMHTGNEGVEYNILPLDDSTREEWQTLYQLTDQQYERALASYDRTAAITGTGMATIQQALADAKTARDEAYLAAVGRTPVDS